MPLVLDEARARAGLVHSPEIAVDYDLTDTAGFGCRAVVSFGCRHPGASTFVELVDATDLVVRRADGDDWVPVDPAYDGERITLRDLAGQNRFEITARLPYVTDGDGMHTVTDPADGERYVCAYTSMDITRRVAPVFDQPDLKTIFTVSVVAPEHWTVLANGRRASCTPGDAGTRRWRFDPTPPISSYLVSLAAGPWASVGWDVVLDGRTVPFGWHARASLRAELERDADELRAITDACFAHFTAVFDEPYPFADYQQVFGPGLNWGAMEFPGVVIFRDEYLFRGEPTALQRALRASIIAHEMAHMWFGDLVTMRWWEDSWLNESFADYMGYAVSASAAGYQDSWVTFSLDRKPTAYRADRRRSTHPVAADAASVPDADTAFANFDMITYAKGAALLRQLVTWLGEDAFHAGANRYFATHRFDNADLGDFLDALDAVTDRDVRGWAAAYLVTTGFDTVRVERDGDGVPVLVRVGSRPHRLSVTAYDDKLAPVGTELVDLAGAPVRLERFAGRAVLPNSGDEAYAALELDRLTWDRLRAGLGRIADPVGRSVAWATVLAAAEAGEVPVADLVDLAGRHLPAETHPAIFEGVAAGVARTLRRYAEPAGLADRLGSLAALARTVLADGDIARHPAAGRLLASTSTDRDLLAGWLRGAGGLPTADQDVRWLLVQRLAALGDDTLIGPEAARDHSHAGALGRLTAEAAIPTAVAKAAAWDRLTSGTLSNREFVAIGAGFWSWGQHDLVAAYLPRYVADGAELARHNGQAFGKLIGDVFPWLPLTAAQRATLRTALAAVLADDERPVPTVLRRAWNDALDDLDRVVATTSARAPVEGSTVDPST